MPYKSEKIRIVNTKYDRRVKLTEKRKNEIRLKYFMKCQYIINGVLHKSISQRSLAKEYGVSRRLIVFVLFPDRYEKSKQRRRDHIKEYNEKYKATHSETIRKHRQYKQGLYLEGKI